MTARRDFFPEAAQPGHALFRSIASDDSGIDGADGNARYPIRYVFRGSERFIDPSLVATEGAATLQHKCNLFVVRGRPSREGRVGHGVSLCEYGRSNHRRVTQPRLRVLVMPHSP